MNRENQSFGYILKAANLICDASMLITYKNQNKGDAENILDIINLVQHQDITNKLCKFCTNGSVVTVFCTYCCEFLDEKCIHFHENITHLLNHKLESIYEENSTVLKFVPIKLCKNPAHQQNKLEKHELLFFCIKCRKYLCEEGIKGHGHDTLELDRPTDLIKFLDFLMGECKIQQNRLLTRLQNLVRTVQSLFDKMVREGTETIASFEWNNIIAEWVTIVEDVRKDNCQQEDSAASISSSPPVQCTDLNRTQAENRCLIAHPEDISCTERNACQELESLDSDIRNAMTEVIDIRTEPITRSSEQELVN